MMSDAITPPETVHWHFALACTNDASGAARVIASLVRDYGELAKVSEARMRREIVERSKLWQERAWAEPGSNSRSLSQDLKRFDIDQRALLWLESCAGLSVMELAWILGAQPQAIRGTLDALERTVDGGRTAAGPELRQAIESAPTDELHTRLAEARSEAAQRDRRRTLVAMLLLALFFILMAAVFISLMNWQGATLPGAQAPDPLTVPPAGTSP
jgi:hypothetical protein